MKTPTLRLSLPGLAALHLLASAPGSHAATTIAAAYSFAYGANLGWMNCRGDVTNGAVVGEFVCSGSIYSANCGWISLGSGTPANGFSYANNSATDFGVNAPLPLTPRLPCDTPAGHTR